jgi:hypothetical protein
LLVCCAMSHVKAIAMLWGCLFLTGCMGYMQTHWSQDVVWYEDMNLRVASIDPDHPPFGPVEAQSIKDALEKCDFYLDAMRNGWTRNDVWSFNKARGLFLGWKKEYLIRYASGMRPAITAEVDHAN